MKARLLNPPARTDRGASAEAIRHHYDVGNDFYALWLDPTMSYSCALFVDGEASLEMAQLSKLDWVGGIIARSGVRRLLEVGCGWGGLLRRLTELHGVEQGVGLTLSPSQLAYAREVSSDHRGLEFRLESWAEHRPSEPYDAVVSIEAFEAFARPEMDEAERAAAYRSFFEACHDALVAGGKLVLQAIAYGSVRDRPEGKAFFAEVFPESDCPSLREMLAAADGLFELELLRNDRSDYTRTLNFWLRNLKRREAEAVAIVGRDTVEFYKKYLALSAIGFRTHSRTLDRTVWARL